MTLPFKLFCNNQWVSKVGAYICEQPPEVINKIQIKLPPTRGQYRIVDCNQDLTVGGNPEDFNTVTWREGWLFWQRTITKRTETPTIEFSVTDLNCAVGVSVTGENTGTQSAVVAFHRPSPTIESWRFICNGANKKGQSTQVCETFAGAKIGLSFEFKTQAIVNLVSSNCGITQKKVFTPAMEGEIAKGLLLIEAPEDICLFAVQTTTNENAKIVKRLAKILTVGKNRSAWELATPAYVPGRGVFAPQKSTMLEVEYFDKTPKLLWRSGAIESPKEGSIEQDVDKFPSMDRLCITAWAYESQSVSSACYHPKTGVRFYEPVPLP